MGEIQSPTMKTGSLLLLLATASLLHADPQLSSWYTADSGQYARIYQTAAAEAAGTKSTTWSRGTGVQSNPTYATAPPAGVKGHTRKLRGHGSVLATRKPRMMKRTEASNASRAAERTSIGPLRQLPPRNTRQEQSAPLLHTLPFVGAPL